MIYKYGTAGFRFDSTELLKISQKIAIGCVEILSKKPFYNNFLAIMITASHNIETDNGVKIINNQGTMIEQCDETILETIVNCNNNELLQIVENLKINPPIITILFGRDTRKSGKQIYNELIKGFELVSNPIFIDADLITTPLFHYIAFHNNLLENKINYLNILNDIQLKFNPIVDCAGGVGAIILQQLNHKNLLICNFPENTILNVDCGSDFVQQTISPPNLNLLGGSDIVQQTISPPNLNLLGCSDIVQQPIYPPNLNLLNSNNYGCSLDGDADRLIFWYKNNIGQFQILDGDNQLVLWSLFLQTIFPSVVAITTPYCNSSTIDFLKKNNIQVIITPTGIKNLQHEAYKYNVAVYFENNGHGTAHYPNDIILKNGQILVKNELIGDGIYNIFTTCQILEELNLSFDDWFHLYKKKDVFQYKIPIQIIPDLQTSGIMYDVIYPIWLKEFIQIETKQYNDRIFLRKSGTEPVIRIFIESNNIQKLTAIVQNKLNK